MDLRICESLAFYYIQAIERADQYMGAMFYRNQPISEILKASYSELKYFNDWHERIAQADIDAAKTPPKK